MADFLQIKSKHCIQPFACEFPWNQISQVALTYRSLVLFTTNICVSPISIFLGRNHERWKRSFSLWVHRLSHQRHFNAYNQLRVCADEFLIFLKYLHRQHHDTMRIILRAHIIAPLHCVPPIELLHNIPCRFGIFFTSTDISVLNNKSRVCRIQNSRHDRITIVRTTHVLSNTSY